MGISGRQNPIPKPQNVEAGRHRHHRYRYALRYAIPAQRPHPESEHVSEDLGRGYRAANHQTGQHSGQFDIVGFEPCEIGHRSEFGAKLTRLDCRQALNISTQALIKFAAKSKHDLQVREIKLVDVRQKPAQ